MSRNRKPQPTAPADAEREAGLDLDRAPVASVDLAFTHPDRLAHVGDPIWQDVSSLAVAGRSIFCTCDETATVERVLYDPDTGEAAGHVNFPLGEIFDLPAGPNGEMDIEGLAIAGGALWICGSHSLKRDKPDDGLADMADLDWDPNRGFLGMVPLVDRGDGVFDLVAAIDPVGGATARTARMLRMDASRRTPLRKMLARDPLIGAFVGLPCKENGLDIEGLAVRGDTVLLGLRGPVLGGLALIVRLEMKPTREGHMKPRRHADGRRYSLQALDLNGQGIRDLLWQGDRLLILSGATTDLEALQSVFAVEEYDPDRAIYAAGALSRVLDLPVVRGSDHAEGLGLLEKDGAENLLVAYDSPHNDRTDKDAQRLTIDVFALASGG
jgi:hypothetical protein